LEVDMDAKRLVRGLAWSGLALVVAAAPLAGTARAANEQAAKTPDGAKRAATDTRQQQLDLERKRSKQIVDEAAEALDATVAALAALEQGDSATALDKLSVATGKLDLLVSRYPESELLPVDVDVSEVDVGATTEQIAAIVDRAEDALDDGRVQVARRLLAPLASEIVIRTQSLPLAAYPVAMRLAVPLIEAGALDDAAIALRSALDTLVVTEEVVPLPVLRAEALVALAEARLEAPAVVESADEGKGEEAAATPAPKELLAAARAELERADALGYGKASKTYPDLVARLDELEKSLRAEAPDKGWRGRLHELRESLAERGSALFE